MSQKVLKGWEWDTSVTPKVKKDTPFTWADGTVKPASGIFWVFDLKVLNSKSKAVEIETVVVGEVDSSVEAKITNRQQAVVNLMAVLIVFIVTAVLVKGISESAGFNALMVFIKLAAVIFVILVGSFTSTGTTGRTTCSLWLDGVSFFGIPLLGQENASGEPIGMLAGRPLSSSRTSASTRVHAREEAKNPQRDVPIGIIASLLICTCCTCRRSRPDWHGALR